VSFRRYGGRPRSRCGALARESAKTESGQYKPPRICGGGSAYQKDSHPPPKPRRDLVPSREFCTQNFY
jgi:hypothetical protein